MKNQENNEKPITGLAKEICIWQDRQQCEDCTLNKCLFCEPDTKYLFYFLTPFLLIIISVLVGIIFSPIKPIIKILFFIGWFGYMFFFLNIWESKMLCNHCPYYANDSEKVLHCPIDKGKLKTGNYEPGPASIAEKVQFIVGASMLIAFPIPFLLFYNLIIPLLLSIMGIFLWILSLQLKICTECINFSCPLNRVSEEIRNEFLKRNPVIKKAWEQKGYEID